MEHKFSWKRMITLAALLTVAASALCAPALLRGDAAQEQRQADVYILAGQSNAAGFSNLSQEMPGRGSSYREYLTDVDVRNGSGYTDVYYYGATEVRADAAMPVITLRSAQIGQGASGNYIGPELGIANVLSDSYTDDNPAVIFKFAVGGTYLCDFEGTAQQTKDFGNWSSPSMTEWATEQGLRLHENNGRLYERLLDVVKTGFAALRAQGYTPSVKGYAWMQGEADAVNTTLSGRYESNLEMFINDLRVDVAEFAGDEDAALRPFVIGKICPSGSYGGYISVVRAAEDAVAQKMQYVYTIDTQDLRITAEDGTLLGSDAYHFNAADMYELGKRFARMITENLAAYSYAVTAGEGGSVGKSVCLSNGESFTVPYTADRGKVLDKVLLNGVDVTSSCLSGGVISFTPTADMAAHNTIELIFADATVYQLTVTVGMGGRIERSPAGSVIYAGDEIVIAVNPSAGYTVDKVLFNGVETAADEDGRYRAVAEGDTSVNVTFRAEETSPGPGTDGEPGGGLGTGAIVGICIAGAAVVAAAVVIVVLMKRRKSKS